MWIANFFKELKVWRTIRKVCKENEQFLESVGLKYDWLGHTLHFLLIFLYFIIIL